MNAGRAAPVLGLLVALAAVSSCGRTTGRCEGRETTLACSCETDRRIEDGTCCPRWSHFSAVTHACEDRSIAQRPLLHDLGPTGAHAVVAAVGSDGRALVAWLVTAEGGNKLLVGEESADGSAFAIREPAAQLRGSSLQASITGGPARTATVAWKQETGLDTAAVHVSERATDGTWRDPARPEDAFSFPPRAFEPRLITTPLGETILVWNQWSAPIYGVQIATRRQGANWSRPSVATDVLSPDAYFANAPTPVSSRQGDVLITWYQAVKTGELAALYSERHGADGTFSHASGDVRLSPPGGDVGGSGGGNPRPAIGPRGEAACAWLQKDNDGRLVPFVASRDPDGPWQTPASALASLGPSTGNANNVRAAFGARGTLLVAWTHDFGDGPVLYGLRRASNGTWLDDPAAPPRLSSEGAKAQSPVLVTGRDGAILLAWTENDQNGSALKLRKSWDDDAMWGPIETLVPAERFADSPAIAVGGTPERVVIAWTEGHDAKLELATID